VLRGMVADACGRVRVWLERACLCRLVGFFFFKQKTAYEIPKRD